MWKTNFPSTGIQNQSPRTINSRDKLGNSYCFTLNFYAQIKTTVAEFLGKILSFLTLPPFDDVVNNS